MKVSGIACCHIPTSFGPGTIRATITAVFKYTFPQWMPSIVVWQPFDYNVVTTALRFGYQLYVTLTHTPLDGDPAAASAYIRKFSGCAGPERHSLPGRVPGCAGARVEAHADIRFNTPAIPRGLPVSCELRRRVPRLLWHSPKWSWRSPHLPTVHGARACAHAGSREHPARASCDRGRGMRLPPSLISITIKI
jgi:hypothetical protein